MNRNTIQIIRLGNISESKYVYCPAELPLYLANANVPWSQNTERIRSLMGPYGGVKARLVIRSYD